MYNVYNPNQQLMNERLNNIANYNPIAPQQQMQMQQQMHPQMQMQQQLPSIKCYAISSVQEIQNFPTDMLNVTTFVNFSENAIYTKQLSENGSAVLQKYVLETNQVVQQEEGETPKNSTILEELTNKINTISEKLLKLEKESKKNEPVVTNTEPSKKR